MTLVKILNLEILNEDPKFKSVDNVIISKYKNISAKACVPDWSEQISVILNLEEIVGTFYKKELQKKIKRSLELKK